MWHAIGMTVVILLASIGALGVVLAAIDLCSTPTPAVAAEAPKTQPQVTNLRLVPQPQPDQPAVLQKTTMSITTTKYVDPTRKEIEAAK